MEIDQAMSLGKSLLLRAFGRPQGVLGRLGGIIMARMNRNIAVRAIELLHVQAHDRVLEIGFGPGVGVELLASLVLSGRVDGVDYSEEMVRQATFRNAAAIDANRVGLRQGSVEDLLFENGTFDKVLAINSMQVWPNAVTGLREIQRVMKRGGRVALAFTPYSGQPKEGLIEVLTEAGFSDVHVVDIDQDFCALATKP
jgi:ubiquinone/menaquinone biosynthesis C-methylase UbiE